MGANHTVGLTFGGLNHEVDAAVVGEGLVQLEGEGLTLADDGGAGGVSTPTSSGGVTEGRPVLLECRCTMPGQPALRCIRREDARSAMRLMREMPKKP